LKDTKPDGADIDEDDDELDEAPTLDDRTAGEEEEGGCAIEEEGDITGADD